MADNWILTRKQGDEPTVVFSDDSEVVVWRMEGEGTSDQHGVGKDSPDPNLEEEPIPIFLEASPVPTSANG